MTWTLEESLVAAHEVAAVFDALGVGYAVGGSVASSLHGVPRATMDVDFVAAMQLEHVDEFVRHLEPTYYVDAAAIREAIVSRDSFNVIRNETVLKVDVFVVADDALSRQELQRAAEVTTVTGQRFRVVSAEDIVVEKLRWWKLGGGVSDRQWRDAVGVLKIQGARFDREYATRRADAMGVVELLEKVLDDAAD